jgi:hypothetical protein
MRLFERSRHRLQITAVVGSLAAVAATLGTMTPAEATPVARQVRIANTDWTSGAAGGIGSASNGGGTGTIAISGISGTVTHAYLAWSGVGPYDGTESVGSYNNPDITVNGSAVHGTSQGESGSNCWGTSATSRTYFADVTSIAQATGDGNYNLAGLGDHGDANGANLIVTYSDADNTNNRDLYLFYGNDTDASGFPGEDNVWNDPLNGINYQGGVANLLAGVADGQAFTNPDDGDFTVTGDGGAVSFADDATTNFLWDGNSSNDAGHSRAPNGSLSDLKSFDVTGAFGAAGTQNLTVSSSLVNDCHSLISVALDVPATGNQPPPPTTVSISPASTVEGTSANGHGTEPLRFKVTRSAPSATDTTVTLHTEDGTATAPEDYKSTSTTITIPAGKRLKIFKVSVRKDSLAEGDEYFYGVIDSASVPVDTSTAVGTIIDDDTANTVANNSARISASRNGGIR